MSEVGSDNQVNKVTGCHVIRIPGLCRVLGFNSSPENAQMWTLQVSFTLANLQKQMDKGPARMHSNPQQSQKPEQQYLWAGWGSAEEPEQSPLGTTAMHIRRTQETGLKDTW